MHRQLWMSIAIVACGLASAVEARAQTPDRCRIICSPELLIEPTWTIENLAARPRVIDGDGQSRTLQRERVFELVIAVDVPTRLSRVGFTSEAIWSPAGGEDNEVELEFELNIGLIQEEQTKGWVSSHFDIVDQFGPAERPTDRAAYTHKLDFELDTAVAVFKWLPQESWLRPIEVEGSLDYLASGVIRRGDLVGDTRYLDRASRWSFSLVLVIPVAPR